MQRDDIQVAFAKDDVGAPIFNYSIAFDRNNSLPLFYEAYPGSIVDVSQLQLMLEKANGYGYKRIGFILDRGYFSKENIRFMEDMAKMTDAGEKMRQEAGEVPFETEQSSAPETQKNDQ